MKVMKKENYPILKLSALVLLLMLIVNCSRTKQPSDHPNSSTGNVYHINLPDKKSDELCKASSIADTVIYVQLQTNSKSLFGYPWLLAMNDSYIVISDKKRIMAFQRDGKFIRQIGKTGKGPEEIGRVLNFLLKGDTLLVTSIGKFGMTKYTIDGKYRKFIKQKFQMLYFSEMPNGGYAWYDFMHGNVVFFNNKWEITDTLSVERNVSKKRELWMQMSTDNQYLVKTNDQLLYKNYRNDTIWDISSKEKKPAIIFNLKEKLLPDKLQVEYTNNLFQEKAKPYQRINIMQTDSFVFILQRGWVPSKQTLFFVYNRATKEIKQYKRPVIYDDIIGNIRLGIFFYFDNTIFSFVDYNDIKNAFEKADSPKVKEFWAQQLTRVKEDDNGMLVIIKTK